MPDIDRRQALALTAAALAAVALAGFAPGFGTGFGTGLGAGPARAQATPAVPEMSLGRDDAPVTLVEYAMFTCPHCAAFNQEVFPELKANYIDTGKVRLVFREVYFDRPSLWAAMIARCAPADRYFGIVDLLFQRQMDWATAADEDAMIEKLMSIGRQAGMTDEQMSACLQDRAKAEAMVATYQKHAAEDAIDATPMFLINGVKVENLPYEELAKKLDEALGA